MVCQGRRTHPRPSARHRPRAACSGALSPAPIGSSTRVARARTPAGRARAFRAVASRRGVQQRGARDGWRGKSPSSRPCKRTSTARTRSPSPASASPAARARRRPRRPGARPSSSRQGSATHLDSSRRWSDCERDAAAQCIAARSEACAGLAGTARPPRGEGDSVAVAGDSLATSATNEVVVVAETVSTPSRQYAIGAQSARARARGAGVGGSAEASAGRRRSGRAPPSQTCQLGAFFPKAF